MVLLAMVYLASCWFGYCTVRVWTLLYKSPCSLLKYSLLQDIFEEKKMVLEKERKMKAGRYCLGDLIGEVSVSHQVTCQHTHKLLYITAITCSLHQSKALSLNSSKSQAETGSDTIQR